MGSDLSTFYGPNAAYVLDLYDRYRQDPGSVDPVTRAFFESWGPPEGESPQRSATTLMEPAAATSAAAPAAPAPAAQATGVPAYTPAPVPPPTPESATHDLASAEAAVTIGPGAAPAEECLPLGISKVVAAARLARLIRELGHRAARLDPLGSAPKGDPDLELDAQGLTPRDLAVLPASVVGGPLAAGAANALEAIARLRRAYCGTIGYEDDHIQIDAERNWLREAAESGRYLHVLGPAEKRQLLHRLTEVEVFERYLHATYVGQKRFSLEGLDMLVPMLDLIIRDAAHAGTREVVMGMAHRGRLNVLAHVLGKPYAAILAEFESSHDTDVEPAVAGTSSPGWTGDVKYHLGAQLEYTETGAGAMPITLAPNPSHLEFVNPVVLGRCRAAQECRDNPGEPEQVPKAAGAILIHGDAAFPGQGIVAETLNLAELTGYCVGGTIHIITNNQIGFTTSPGEGRSTLYASDPAKGYEIPIVHVNADDPVACVAAAQMAYAYCVQFHKDFLIDLVGYRRWGHNEGDEPTYTQPRMYEVIASHPTVRELWARQLESEGIVRHAEADAMIEETTDRLEQARSLVAEAASPNGTDPDAHAHEAGGGMRAVRTAIPAKEVVDLNEQLLARPRGFTGVRKLERNLQRRREALNEEGGIDWGHAEALAFASILADGTPIRMSGQDIERGTFSHRHLVLHDPKTGAEYVPLQAMPAARASFAIYNSPLSENAVVGFEYGYSMHARETLVIWEAQFGDFANSAQVIIDQFIISGNAKWRQAPSLVLLLPHGLEGQGPEHSSARLERWLQLCAGDNLRVVYPTTSAQYFHVLRRQAALVVSDPRPLVVMSPKSLLRHPRAGSSLSDLVEGRFAPVLDDAQAQADPGRVRRLILCSGRIYVDLVSHKRYAEAEGIAVVRIEELYPFPEDEIRAILSRYRNVRQVDWLQEEPRNMGAWTFVAPRLRDLLDNRIPLTYIGRPEAASPAEGSVRQHAAEQMRILTAALMGAPGPEIPRSEVEHAR